MKIFIDTNIILVVLCNRKEFVENSSNVLKLYEVKIVIGFLSTLSIYNIIYILRKELNNEKKKQ